MVRASEIPVNLPADVSVVQRALLIDWVNDSSFFEDHFLRISEITELLNIDVLAYLKLHAEKGEALERYITQLENKKEETKEAYASLEQLNTFHTSAFAKKQTEIKNTQIAIESAYNQRNADDVIRGIITLEELHTEEQEHKTISVFATRIGGEYRALINAAEQKISVLRANTDPLVKGTTVNLPQGININVLKDLQLFATEIK